MGGPSSGGECADNGGLYSLSTKVPDDRGRGQVPQQGRLLGTQARGQIGRLAATGSY